tara:strand:+ start:273 stop:896 length:624 start_codon:yes stop_codon:yes gene_type:complete
MKQLLDLATWARKEHYHFFKQFSEPFFGITTEIDCTIAYEKCKANKRSFFIYYMYQSLVAANETEPFRYRIENDQVYIYDQTHASSTIDRENGTFGFSYIDFYDTWEEFEKYAVIEIDRVRQSNSLMPARLSENLIHYSSIPWIKFTSLSHARNFAFADSTPKITFGKMSLENNRRMLPVSIHVHHALMDGLHVGEFVNRYQELMNS